MDRSRVPDPGARTRDEIHGRSKARRSPSICRSRRRRCSDPRGSYAATARARVDVSDAWTGRHRSLRHKARLPTTTPRPPLAPRSLRGHVFAADTGLPLRKAQVRIFAGEIRENRLATTDVDGAYEFKEVKAGRYTINANKGSYVSLSYGQTRPTDASKPLQILDNQTVERVDLVAAPRQRDHRPHRRRVRRADVGRADRAAALPDRQRPAAARAQRSANANRRHGRVPAVRHPAGAVLPLGDVASDQFDEQRGQDRLRADLLPRHRQPGPGETADDCRRPADQRHRDGAQADPRDTDQWHRDHVRRQADERFGDADVDRRLRVQLRRVSADARRQLQHQRRRAGRVHAARAKLRSRRSGGRRNRDREDHRHRRRHHRPPPHRIESRRSRRAASSSIQRQRPASRWA